MQSNKWILLCLHGICNTKRKEALLLHLAVQDIIFTLHDTCGDVYDRAENKLDEYFAPQKKHSL